jgi:hypothetical protein
MRKILEGQISFGGMQDALEAVVRHKNVKNGVLSVTSNSCSGLMGVFCGRFITGAMLTLSGEVGLPALRQLLSAKDGAFALLDMSDEPVADLNQSLGVDLQAVLASVDFSLDTIPVSEESLIGLAVSNEEIRTINTNVSEEVIPAEQLTPERINQTFQRIVKLSDHLAAQPSLSEPVPAVPVETWSAAPPMPPQSDVPTRGENDFHDQPPEWERRKQDNSLPMAIELGSGEPVKYQSLAQPVRAVPDPGAQSANRERDAKYSDTGNYAVVFDAAPQEPRFKSNDEFKRLKSWKTNSQIIVMVLWLLVLVGIGAAIYTYGPQLAHIVASVLPKHK